MKAEQKEDENGGKWTIEEFQANLPEVRILHDQLIFRARFPFIRSGRSESTGSCRG